MHPASKIKMMSRAAAISHKCLPAILSSGGWDFGARARELSIMDSLLKLFFSSGFFILHLFVLGILRRVTIRMLLVIREKIRRG
jgi:hypothetical protein